MPADDCTLKARQVPSSARNEQVNILKLFSYHSHVSIAVARLRFGRIRIVETTQGGLGTSRGEGTYTAYCLGTHSPAPQRLLTGARGSQGSSGRPASVATGMVFYKLLFVFNPQSSPYCAVSGYKLPVARPPRRYAYGHGAKNQPKPSGVPR